MRFTLRKKIILLILVLLIISILVSSLISTFEIQKYYKGQLFDQMSVQLAEVDFLLAQSEYNFDRPEDYQYFDHFIQSSKNRLTFIDSVGMVVYDSNVPYDSLQYLENHMHRPEIQMAQTMPVGQNQRTSTTLNLPMYYAARKFTNPDKQSNVHYIRLALPMQYIDSILNTVRIKIISAGGMALVVIVIISYLVVNYLTYPIQGLALAAKQIKQGDTFARFQHNANDELGELADLLNDMLDKLRDDLVQMKKLQRMRSQFLGNVSHELRTPIFTVQGYLETMMQNPKADTKLLQKFTKKAHRQAVRLNNLLNDLIDISRIESGEMEMTFSSFNLHWWLQKVVEDYSEIAVEQHVTLKLFNTIRTDLQVWGDLSRLNQVMHNLVMNAIKYNIDGGKVEIGYIDKQSKVEIFVKDSGRGIEEEHLSRIFERFYRVDKERSREVGGTGLGLAIVKHIVEAHHSHIKVESVVNNGSRFNFSLRKAKA